MVVALTLMDRAVLRLALLPEGEGEEAPAVLAELPD
jgi:hypothetical protein